MSVVVVEDNKVPGEIHLTYDNDDPLILIKVVLDCITSVAVSFLINFAYCSFVVGRNFMSGKDSSLVKHQQGYYV